MTPVVVVPPSDPRIQYIGRFDVSNPDAPRFAWSGSIIKARYQAERVALLLQDDPPANRTDDSDVASPRDAGVDITAIFASPFEPYLE